MVILGAQRLGMFDRVMSALGQKQTYAVHKPMSAPPPQGMCANQRKTTRTASVLVFASFTVKAQLNRNYCV